jgi:cell division septation protein DedD
MPRNDDGEFELVLGNRQLLSGFFIVVILFGVFFTMGYIVGRHSAPVTPVVSAERGGPGDAKSGGDERPAPAPGQAEVVTDSKKPVESAPAETKPAAESAKPVETKPAAAPPKPEPKKEIVKAEKKPAPEPKGGSPVKGEVYLQVSAPRKEAASGVLDALRKKGMEPTTAPGPNDATVRILVGPFKDTAAMGKTRAELEAAGFKGIFQKRY